MKRRTTATLALAAILPLGASGLIAGAQPTASIASPSQTMHPQLQAYIAARIAEFDTIPAYRRVILDNLGTHIAERATDGKPCELTFICTHNSRRSHLGQVWGAVAAAHFGVPGTTTYSGGTEVTAFNPRAVAALERAGLAIEKTTEASNPIYHVRFGPDAPALTCFSKVFNQAPNPTRDFCAVMTCDDADQKCPIVHGAAARFAIPYEDPKAFDGHKLESAKYDERCAQIARELLYALSRTSMSE
jgi:hypothetical protein